MSRQHGAGTQDRGREPPPKRRDPPPPPPPPRPASDRPPIPLVIAVVLTAILEVLDITIVNVAMPHMLGAFGTTADQITLSLIHISEPTRLGMISYAVFCL